MSGSLGVVVPAYEPDVELLSTYVRGLDERLAPATIRIEVDAPDPDVVDALESLPAEVSVSPERRGKGAAITAGFEALAPDVEYLLFVDADGSTAAEYAAHVVEAVFDGADVAAGSRRHPEARVLSHQTFARRRLGDAFAWTARRLLAAKLYDYQCGAKAITTAAWERVRPHLYEPGFAWDVELLAVAGALDLDIREVPIEWEDAPESTVDPVRTTLDMGRALFVVRHRAKRIGDRSPPPATRAREETALVERE
ncbi:glycosyltransferase [Salinirubellus salinus]|uniref:Glycosyltransferase n=1 Tax=Salinirubellus salinus TaxID=1364945 RepID=A0A9E7R8S6_9EURY|nr:glycosyltransferase [Salinirubellus salinus]UWM56618.1 glycosyltransferase [Salinirubellus salinus]